MINKTPNPYKIAPGHITTPWAQDVNPQLPLPEYPRPQMVREEWLNLNGLWSCAVAPKDAPQPAAFPDQILVPYPIESALSGIKRPLNPDETLWYHRTFELDPAWHGGRILIHFGAVDWSCQLLINGQQVGEHTGGFDPFSFDITDALLPGENNLVMAVQDPTDAEPIQRGKQMRKPGFIWYTAVSGIWQTVWLEHVPESYLTSLKIIPDIDQETVTLFTSANNTFPELTIEAAVLDQGKVIAQGKAEPGRALTIPLPQSHLWSPDSPYLYDLSVSLVRDGIVIDQIQSYFGMRKFSLERTQDGILRFHLNNEPCFLYGPLDQGYWPDGLFTPPSDEAMRWEIDFLKEAGFNMLRKHVKIEPARYYYHCDRAGMIVWQDMVNGGISPHPIWFVLVSLFKKRRDDCCYGRLGRKKHENRELFRQEYQRMLDTLHNVVSIAIWCPFNEGWGQFDAAEIAAWTTRYDPTRLVDHASGWFDQGAGDFQSLHVYFKALPQLQIEPDRGLVLSEFGGFSLKLPDHTWHPQKAFGYKKFQTQEALTKAYLELVEKQLFPMIKAGLSAAVYTQTTDVESELNGCLTYDRKVIKLDLAAIKNIHQKLFEFFKSINT